MLPWPSSLLKGTLIKRYRRFLADVRLDSGAVVTVHCPNSGAMLGVNMPGLTVYVSRSDNLSRKLPYTLEIVAADGVMVGVNTGIPNKLVLRALQAGMIPELTGYTTIKPEASIGASRLDFKLTSPDRPDCYVEVKNCHLMRTPGLLEFPDGITTRGAKHLQELIQLRGQGARAVMLYIGQRDDLMCFQAAADLDPVYAATLKKAVESGVEAYCYSTSLSQEGIVLHKRIPVI